MANWWDEECREKKRKLRRRVKNAQSEGQIWKVVNEGRKRRGAINADIEMEKWDEHFRESLGGKEDMVRREGSVKEEITEERDEMEEGDITLEEVKDMVKKMKDHKAMREDGIPNEAWKYGWEKVIL
ncbi:GSCOCG00011179001-RA-CDS [Cotesia congregata]|nr:GSCOCG00011179001-RA-CDS [Cotesia congregata]